MSDVRVLHFWSPTCGPCTVIKPALEDIKEEFDGRIEWTSINTRDDPDEHTQTLHISVVPSFVVFKGEVEVGRYSGTQVSIVYQLIRKGLHA